LVIPKLVSKLDDTFFVRARPNYLKNALSKTAHPKLNLSRIPDDLD
jgi:hypothetical protein